MKTLITFVGHASGMPNSKRQLKARGNPSPSCGVVEVAGTQSPLVANHKGQTGQSGIDINGGSLENSSPLPPQPTTTQPTTTQPTTATPAKITTQPTTATPASTATQASTATPASTATTTTPAPVNNCGDFCKSKSEYKYN